MALVFVAGFGELLAFWLLGSWHPRHPGLFDYRAATVGDGALLPLGAAVLYCGMAWTRAPSQGWRRKSLLFAAGGLLAGGAVQATWLADPHPHLNWTIPAAHVFATPGVTHGIFFVIGAGVFAGMTTEVLLRVRTDERRMQLARRGWANALTFVASGFLGLAAIDDVTASDTAAGIGTACGLAAVVLGLVVTIWRAFNQTPGLGYREIASGAAAGFGLAALSAHGAAGFTVWQAGAVALILAALTAALVPEVATWAEPATRWALAAVWLTLAGGTSLGAFLSERHGVQAAGVVIAAGVVARAFGTIRQPRLTDRALSYVAVAFTLALLVLTRWLGGHVRQDDATYTLGFAAFFLDGLVIGLIRERFGEAMDAGDAFAQAPHGSSHAESVGSVILVQVIGFGLAALGALILMYVAAGQVLGINDGATGAAPVDASALILGGVGFLLALAAAVGTHRTGASRRHDTVVLEPPRQRGRPRGNGRLKTRLPGVPTLAAFVGLVAWMVAVLRQPAIGEHVPVAGAIAALVFGVLVCEDVSRTGARLHAHRPGVATRVLGLTAGAASGAALLWLLTAGIWSGTKPAAIAPVAIAAVGVLLTNFIVVRLALEPVTRGLRVARPLTPDGIGANLTLVGLLNAALVFIAFVIPFVVLGRVELFHPRNAGLATVSTLAPLPSLIFAVLWVLDNNARHLQGQLRDRPDTDLAIRLNQFRDPEVASRVRNAWFECHITFQGRWAKLAVVLGAVLVLGSVLFLW